jgi:hypothetical protein
MTDRFAVRQRVLILGSRLLGRAAKENWCRAWVCGHPWSAFEFEKAVKNLVDLDLHYLALNIEHYQHGSIDLENEESIARRAGVNAWVRTFAECEDIFNEFTPYGHPIPKPVKAQIDQIMASHRPLSFRWRSSNYEDIAETDRLIRWLAGISISSKGQEPCI